MDSTKTLILESGTEITLRRPTEAEALALTDKRWDSKNGRAGQNYLDDGDEEILACVASPSRDTIEEILDDAPLLTRELERHLRVMGGDDLALVEDPSLITPALTEANGKRLMGLRLGGKEAAETVIVRKLDRLSLKFLDRDAAAEKRIAPSYAQLAKMAKEQIVGAAPDWERYPFLSQNIGALLYLSARAKVREREGK